MPAVRSLLPQAPSSSTIQRAAANTAAVAKNTIAVSGMNVRP